MALWSSFKLPARSPEAIFPSSSLTMPSSWLPKLAGMDRVSRVRVRSRLPCTCWEEL